MPIYEYACNSCEHTLDALQKMSDDALVDCPECGQPTLRKLLSAPRFRLKGKGWYETDFKKDNKRNLAGDGEKSSKPKDADDRQRRDSKSSRGQAAEGSRESVAGQARPTQLEAVHRESVSPLPGRRHAGLAAAGCHLPADSICGQPDGPDAEVDSGASTSQACCCSSCSIRPSRCTYRASA